MRSSAALAMLYACVFVTALLFATDASLVADKAPGNADPVPKWPKIFNIQFNETSIILLKRTTQGEWWYDAEHGNEVVKREDGRGDPYCGGLHPIDASPCTQLATGGNRYIIFPELNECCRCCSTESCSLLPADWLEGAQFQGQEDKYGKPTYKWLRKNGIQRTYYWSTADDAQLPVEYDVWPNYYQTFHSETFSAVKEIDPALLKVPDNCKPECPLATLCTVSSRKNEAAH